MEIEKIIIELNQKLLSHSQIAEKYNCSLSAISQIAKEHSLQFGRGKKYHWSFIDSTPEFAYLMGAFITDGYVGKNHRTKKPIQVTFSSVDIEFINRIQHCLEVCNLHPRRQKDNDRIESRLGNKTQYVIATYVSDFANWALIETDSKSKIPAFLHSAPIADKVAFLSGVIDGDGYVAKEGTIRIREVDKWLSDLPEFCRSIGVRATDYELAELLPSGKEYMGVYIRRSDFMKLGGYCYIPEKQNRLTNGKDTRKRKH